MTVVHARLNPDVVQDRRSGGCHAMSTKQPVTLLVPSPGPSNSPKRGATAKKVEMLFAHLKRILRLGRLRLRGPRGAQFEFTLAAIAQNLRRLAKLLVRPPPAA